MARLGSSTLCRQRDRFVGGFRPDGGASCVRGLSLFTRISSIRRLEAQQNLQKAAIQRSFFRQKKRNLTYTYILGLAPSQ